MAKQAKMKKGSIGKKALAAILAASMVLSSSAFSVLASVSVPGDGDVTVPDEGIATASLSEDNGIATAALTDPDDRIMLGFEENGMMLTGAPSDIFFNNDVHKPNVVVVHCKNPSHENIYQCWEAADFDWNNASDSTCHLVDKTKRAYSVTWGGDLKNAADGWKDKETGAIQDHGPSAEAKFAAAGPYVCVNFSNNQLTGEDAEKNPYKDLGSYYISFNIQPLDLDDVPYAITKLQYPHTYNGKKNYPGMEGIKITLNGEELTLREGIDYVAEPATPDCDDIISASDLQAGANGDPTRPVENSKKVVLKGIASTFVDTNGNGEKDADESFVKGNYKGTLGDQYYDGDQDPSKLNVPGYDADNFYPDPVNKTNDYEILYHINQKPAADGDIQVSDFEVERRVGDRTKVTRDYIIGLLNGTDGTAKVIDTLRAVDDTKQRNMRCFTKELDSAGNYKTDPTWTDADYTVKFEKNGSWVDEPDITEGAHRFQITTTGETDYVKGKNIVGTYTIKNPSRLQRAIDEGCAIKGIPGTNGTVTLPYNGTDYYPAKWDSTTISIGTITDLNGNVMNSSPVYGVDYEITSAKEVWRNAKTYELTLQGKGGIKDETATINVVVTPRNINKLSDGLSDIKVIDDETQGFENKGGTAGNNGTEISTGKYNIENTKKADTNSLTGDQKSVVRVLVEQGVHTNASVRSDVVVEVTDYGLDSSVGDHGKVTLVEGVDYEVSDVKERTNTNGSKTKYVEIKGIGNYTTTLKEDNKNVATVYVEDIDLLAKMPLNSKRITASVDPATYVIDQRTDKIQLDVEKNIKLVENTPGQEPKTLTKAEYYIEGYEQNGIKYTTEQGIQKPGKAYVIVGAVTDSKYINTVKIPFTVTSTDFESEITIDAIPDKALSAAVENLDGVDMADHLDEYVVVRYAAEQTATFPRDYYTVTVKDSDGNAIATRKYDTGQKKLVWYVGDGKSENVMAAGEVSLERGEYEIVVESTDPRYEGTAKTGFKVIGEDIAEGKTITYTEAYDYNGNAIEPEVTVTTKDNIVLLKDRDYTVEYDYNVDAGTGRILLNGIGNYSGSVSKTFTIKQVDGTVALEAAQKAKLESGVDAGGSEAPVVETYVKDEKVDDAKMTYSLSSSDTNVVAIAADGKTMNYVGGGTATITLTPSSTNVKAEAITFTVTVNAAAVVEPEAHLTTKHYSTKAKTIGLTTNKIEEATKWQVRYATNKDMSGKYTKTVKKAKRLYHLTLNVKKSKTKYYVRVRAYVNGKWTKWSEKESIKSR